MSIDFYMFFIKWNFKGSYFSKKFYTTKELVLSFIEILLKSTIKWLLNI